MAPAPHDARVARAAAEAAVEMWRDRLAAAARNLADLNGSEDVRRLRARLAGPDAYEGATLALAARVAAALDGLWADYLLVSRAVEEAEALLRRPPFAPVLGSVFGPVLGGAFGQGRAGEAAAMLDGASIRLPAVSVPLRARGLLDAAERSAAVTPAAVLDAMVEGFEAARRGAAAIAAAAAATRVKLDALRAWLEGGAGAGPAAREPALAARLDAAARALDRDPLAAAELVAPLTAALADARAEAEAAERRRAALAEAFARARADLAALRSALDRRTELRRAAADLFAAPAAAGHGPAAEADGADLAAWLDRLAAAETTGQGGAAAVGLGRWGEACAAARRAAEAEAERIAAASRERDHLRGRFRALRAKAAALVAAGGAGSPAPSPDPAAAALDARPFDAGRARTLLADYEAALGAAADGRRPGWRP